MARPLAFLAVLSVTLFAAVCNGRATNNDLTELTHRLKELLENNEKNDDVRDSWENEEDSDEEIEGRIQDVVRAAERHFARSSGLSDAQKNKVIDMHNELRRGEGASDMHQLKYNDKLARLAQEWADRCAWGHRPSDSFQASDYGFQNVGENIWAWSDDSKSIPEAPIQDWFDEKTYYDYGSMSCRKEPCGHYTAVTWSSTQEVGCGLAKCSVLHSTGMTNSNFFVCNYGPGGNDYGKRPFKKGQACSECGTGKFFCTNSLCDASCSSPQGGNKCECKANCNQGKKTNDCKCQCNKGYTGVSCQDQCRDTDSQCNAGWPPMFCRKDVFNGMMYDQVNEKCPKMCGKCESKKRSVEEFELLTSLLTRMEEEKK